MKIVLVMAKLWPPRRLSLETLPQYSVGESTRGQWLMWIRFIAGLAAVIAAVGMAGSAPAAATEVFNADGRMAPEISGQREQHVGTYEQFTTPMGSSISVLMTEGRKFKIAAVDDTEYVDIPINGMIPEMQIGGTYRIDGEFKLTSTASGGVFTVRRIEYLGGGRPVQDEDYHRLPDFFAVDGSASGPLTSAELRIQFPVALARFFTAEDRECFDREVESRSAQLGDPVTMDPSRRVLLVNSQAQWDALSNGDKRLKLARYVTSMALHAC